MATAPQPRRVAAAQATGAMLIEHCDIPAEFTIAEWQKACAIGRRAARDSRDGLRGSVRRALRRW